MVLFLLIILIMISVYWRPMQGIIRGLLLGFLFVFGGSFLNIPVPVSDRRHAHCNRFLFLIYHKARKAGQ